MENITHSGIEIRETEQYSQNKASLDHSTHIPVINVGASSQNVTSALSKPAKACQNKVKKKINLPFHSVDIMVQKTNDDSVTSKRSAVACGYFEDPFLRYFVRKPSRRSPLVNRGYYLRMMVISDIMINCINYFMENSTASVDMPLHVISLGAGYDTLALRVLLSNHSIQGEVGGHRKKSNVYNAFNSRWKKLSRRECVRFCDIDFPEVMQAKAALMQAAPPGSFPLDFFFDPSDSTHPIVSKQYYALGLDLRESLQTLSEFLTKSLPGFSVDSPLLFYAECMMQYMPSNDATALIRGIASQFPNAIFISYDQISPDDSFGKVMVRALKQKASPLLGIHTTPDGSALVSRLIAQGMAYAVFSNFYDISSFYLNGDERERVNALEPFDELEEWSEMCEHYGITLAGTSISSMPSVSCIGPFFHPLVPLFPLEDLITGQETAKLNISVRYSPWPTGRFSYEGWGNGEVHVELHPYTKEWVFFGFGGFLAPSTGGHRRESNVFAHAFQEGAMKVNLSSTLEIPPQLVFHSFSRLSPFLYFVFGGRGSPAAPNKTAYLLQTVVSQMSEVSVCWNSLKCVGQKDGEGAIPSARYRHTAITLSNSEVFVFGGKNVYGEIINDAWIANIDVSARTVHWQEIIFPLSSALPAMCSAAAVLGSQKGEVLLSGGLMANGECNRVLWRVDTVSKTCTPVSISYEGGGLCSCARFSHTMTRLFVNGIEQVLILGGCGSEPRERRPPALLLNAQTMTVIPLKLPPECPTWARHCCAALGKGRLGIIGGGFTCFSFGTFAAKPALLEIGDDVDPPPTPLSPLYTESSQATATANMGDLKDYNPKNTILLTSLLSLPRPPVEEAKGPLALDKVLQAMRECLQPIVIRGTSLGSCLEKWADPAYLKEAAKDSVVSVHVSKGSHVLDFVRKNFSFRHVPFQDLIQHMQDATSYYRTHKKVPEECWYFRSIATHMKSERANLWEDFKVLGKDFSLPDGIREYIMPRMHQSCLRINAAPLQLWTHYDAMENVLVQIVGRKRVVLFPPSQYGNLYMNGSSSPVLNIDAPNLIQYPRFIDAAKNALEVTIEPGDFLYFPANWYHHIITLAEESDDAPPYSLSVNVFYRRFNSSNYDKKDLYGNKDLPAVVELRQKITTNVQDLLDRQLLNTDGEPLCLEYKEFALRQALQYLESVADSIAASAKK